MVIGSCRTVCARIGKVRYGPIYLYTRRQPGRLLTPNPSIAARECPGEKFGDHRAGQRPPCTRSRGDPAHASRGTRIRGGCGVCIRELRRCVGQAVERENRVPASRGPGFQNPLICRGLRYLEGPGAPFPVQGRPEGRRQRFYKIAFLHQVVCRPGRVWSAANGSVAIRLDSCLSKKTSGARCLVGMTRI